MTGTCKYCGCTQAHACADAQGGCAWIDDEQTICSACIEVVHLEELLGLAKRDLLAHGTNTAQISLSVARLTVLCQSMIVALMAGLPVKSGATAHEFVQQMLDDVFAHYPAIRETLRRDFDLVPPAPAQPANASS